LAVARSTYQSWQIAFVGGWPFIERVSAGVGDLTQMSPHGRAITTSGSTTAPSATI